jgi:isoleucyl-tRNA synthetase
MVEMFTQENRSELPEEYIRIIKDELNVKEVVLGEVNQLDTEITPALKDEGDMRELLRKIQEMRKEAGLEPKDKVAVSLTDTEPAWFPTFADELKNSVGAETIVWGSGETNVKKI